MTNSEHELEFTFAKKSVFEYLKYMSIVKYNQQPKKVTETEKH